MFIFTELLYKSVNGTQMTQIKQMNTDLILKITSNPCKSVRSVSSACHLPHFK